MMRKAPLGMPLNRDELIKLKHQIEPMDYLVVESGHERILVIRTEREFPDLVNDLECMINKLDIRDTNELSHALIIGEEEVVGVPLKAIEALIERRMEEDERIATDLSEKLIEPYTTLLFESENDPIKTLRLGIRVAGNIGDFKPQQLPEMLFSKIKSLPRRSEVIYLIADDGYIRLSGTEFYRRLGEFLKANPNINKELAKEFIYLTRGKLADYFIEKGLDDDVLSQGRQENINQYLTTEASQPSSEPPTTKIAEDKDVEITEELPEPAQREASEVEAEVEGEVEAEVGSESVKEEQLKQSEKSMVERLGAQTDIKTETKSDTDQSWPSSTSFIIKLQEKLSETGFEVVHGLEIPGSDIVANNPDSIINRVFFCYMPEFNLKKALALERSINRYSPELSIIIGASDDPDLRLFAVGKNILITDIDTILNTNLLVNLEEHI